MLYIVSFLLSFGLSFSLLIIVYKWRDPAFFWVMRIVSFSCLGAFAWDWGSSEERDRGGFAVFAAFVFGLLFVLVWGVGKFRRGRKRREGGR